ncbi:MAG: hypothetical protein ACP5US_10065 [Candidatus Kryptoniota bacterium]
MNIASLLPGATEIVYALRLEDQLVGVSRECNHPPAVKIILKLTNSTINPLLDSSNIESYVRKRKILPLEFYE